MTDMTPTDFYGAELRRLDLLLHREILRMRGRYALSLDEFRGLYVSDAQVDAYVDAPQSTPIASEEAFGLYQGEPQIEALRTVDALSAQADWLRCRNAPLLTETHPWSRLAREFGLSAHEMDILLLALAPDLDPKYESLYAYLNNDISRKWPSHDLALRIVSPDGIKSDTGYGGWTPLRASLLPGGPLYGQGLLLPAERPPDRMSWLAEGFSIARPVAAFALGLGAWDALPLTGFVHVHRASGTSDHGPVATDLEQAAGFFVEPRMSGAPVLVLEGSPGSAMLDAASTLCNRLGLPLLSLDISLVPLTEPPEQALAGLRLCARLDGAGIYLENMNSLVGAEGSALPGAHALVRSLAALPGPVIAPCPPGAAGLDLFRGVRSVHFTFHNPDYDERRGLWSRYLAIAGASASDSTLEAVAGRFQLTTDQIAAAVRAVADHRQLEHAGEGSGVEGQKAEGGRRKAESSGPSSVVGLDELLAAARWQSDAGLGKLAVKVSSLHDWNDLVLPPGTLRQVREVASAIQHHHLIYGQWGFARRVSSGRGLKVLFAGASGTGKTMATGVVARSLGLDLYKIDLSGVVSKYIGETEKNLDRIFEAARNANAILFFDEADALFGKRSEVKDAHDRYANIEVSYLLQKLEEHEGAVILASNLSHNIDRAFSRRMHYVVEFPMPDEVQREQIWRGMFPTQAPLGADVNFEFLARRFTIAGGDIQNVALDAAFLAASDGRVVSMSHLVKAMSRQLLKNGQLPSAGDFREYYSLVGS